MHHVAIIIPKGEEELARQFYCNVLGAKEIAKPESHRTNGGIWVEVSGVQIHLSIDEGFDPRSTRAHIGYEVGDLAPLKEKLNRVGITVKDKGMLENYKTAEFRDPFGNRIELLQAT